MITVFISRADRITIRELSACSSRDPGFYLHLAILLEQCIRAEGQWAADTLEATPFERLMWNHAEAMVLLKHFNELPTDL